ncbi:MAG TPA: DUF1847 domain-containing protein [Thermodesulfobacteriota bacterium]|nr:DUF1847 domain-containing protein [Thermodesulfobacteriota bacterium]
MKTTCAECGVYKCRYPDEKRPAPGSCPRKKYAKVVNESAEKSRADAGILRINAACEEVLKRGADPDFKWTRTRELIEYARILHYRKIGIAGCAGLMEESKILSRILTDAGFDVVLVSCMAGGAPRAKFGLKERSGGSAFACNPLMQAEVLNHEKTELNVMVGLCLGHDILFTRYSEADVTPLIVKDRVTGHNPVAALYTSQSYYKKKLWNPPTRKSPLPARGKNTPPRHSALAKG